MLSRGPKFWQHASFMERHWVMRKSIMVAVCAFGLSARASDGEIAARMEAWDHATCEREAAGSAQAYARCRDSLVTYRFDGSAATRSSR